jgi:hypothetical protein
VQAESTEEAVCEWEDEEGRKLCKEALHEMNGDTYLPSSNGNKDFVDDDDYYEKEGEHKDEDHEDDDDDEEEWNLRKQDKDWDVWKHGSNGDLYQALECPSYDNDFSDTSFENIHTVETWHTFNRIYNEVIAATKDTDLEQESTIPSTFDKHGFQFPIEIKFQPNIGRGVFAKTDIPKGSLLYVSTNNAAFFNGQTYRNFINALPPKLACDVTIWAFVRWVSLETEENDVHMVCVDLDEGSFVNSSDDDSQYNMALGNDKGTLYQEAAEEEERELWYGCKMKFWASRDIKAGEEIRASYNDFVERDGWRFLTL